MMHRFISAQIQADGGGYTNTCKEILGWLITILTGQNNVILKYRNFAFP